MTQTISDLTSVLEGCMSKPSPGEVSILLHAWRGGDKRALDRLLPLVYAELRRISHRRVARQRASHSLQTTALINEAYIRLADLGHLKWQDRAHFFRHRGHPDAPHPG